jgi:hypothetical protein
LEEKMDKKEMIPAQFVLQLPVQAVPIDRSPAGQAAAAHTSSAEGVSPSSPLGDLCRLYGGGDVCGILD